MGIINVTIKLVVIKLILDEEEIVFIVKRNFFLAFTRWIKHNFEI